MAVRRMLFSRVMKPGHAEQLPLTAERLSALLKLTESIATERSLSKLFTQLAHLLRTVVGFNLSYVSLYDSKHDVMRLHLIDTEFPVDVLIGQEWPAKEQPGKLVVDTQESILVHEVDQERRFPALIALFKEYGIHSFCMVPLTTSLKRLGVLNLASLKTGTYRDEDRRFLQLVSAQVAMAVDNAMAYQEIQRLKNRLTREKLYLEDEIQSEVRFKEIIGESRALKTVFEQVGKVAPTDSTVLLLGETGTGKELIARSIHEQSERVKRTFVKINCSAIPTGLLESELFGHERGAFTGALTQRFGRFEIADGGTLFLDEVGDIPLEVQPKLLRVLQEREFERLGNSRTIRTNVRVIAATNRDLSEMVGKREFRADLFYRLNVFPVRLPSLRERREDIPRLVRYFTQRYCSRMNRQITSIPDETLRALGAWSWPGNIRELENFIERSVILSTGPVLEAPLSELSAASNPTSAGGSMLDESERQLILKVLHEVDWVIGGPAGAAARLGMKRTSLQSRMKRLDIVRPKVGSAL
jgi:formate hydrogenlyase transcriptional activator